MPFNSIGYLIFFAVIYLIFYFAGERYRWQILLLGSYIFYGFLLEPTLLIVLTFVILITYYVGQLLDASEDGNRRRNILFVGVFANLSFLIYFKYLPFLIGNLNVLLDMVSPDIALEVPPLLASIALSFFIFQAISYLADIYFRMAKPEPSFGYFALYISFFPKLLQGPIERCGTLLPQLKTPFKFDYDTTRSGMLLFGWGLFLKVVVADRLALYVNPVFNDVHAYTGLPLLIGTYGYSLQLYFDFVGYTNMALGTALIFGIKLTNNFNSPYLATNCSDFWRRWHISFSRWILDYVFEPLQITLRNLGKSGTALALFITFLLAGLWHGASWGFIIFGALHGLYLMSSVYYRPYKKKLHKRLGISKSKWLKVWQIFVTFNLVSLAFIFFRAANVQDAIYIVKNIGNLYNNYVSTYTHGLHDFIRDNIMMGNNRFDTVIVLATFLVIYFSYKYRNIDLFGKPLWVRWITYNMLILAVTMLGVGKASFLYFQF